MRPNRMMMSKKAYDIWQSIAYRWFDYDAMSYVTNRAYNIHLEIEHILIFGHGWDREN